MNSRQLGKQGFEVSEVGLGCWQLGNDWGELMPGEQAFQILRSAVENGITFFDTADVYGSGRSERLIGEFLEGQSMDIKVATKFGRMAGVYPDNYTKDVLKKYVYDSLERLKTDSLDLLQLHCIPMAVMQDGNIFDWLRELQDEGIIKHFGASVESIEEGILCMQQDGLQSLQVIFNVLRQKPLEKLFPMALEKEVGIIVRLPLASGLLAGKYNAKTTFPANDHRNFNKDGKHFNVGETFSGLPLDKGIKLTEELKGFCPSEMSMVDFALRWILDQEAVTTVIPGASRPDQVVSNVKASDFPMLSYQLKKDLKEYYSSKVHNCIRGTY